MKKFTEETLHLIISDVTGFISPEEKNELNNIMRRFPHIEKASRFVYHNAGIEDVPTPTEAEAYEFVERIIEEINANRQKLSVLPKG